MKERPHLLLQRLRVGLNGFDVQLKLGCCCFCSDALVFLLRMHALLLLQLKLHALALSLCLSSRRTEGSLGSLMGCNCLVQQRCSASVTHTRAHAR